jgi:hypothetical protein
VTFRLRIIAASALGATLAAAHPCQAGPWMLTRNDYYIQLVGGGYTSDGIFNDDSERQLFPAGKDSAERAVNLYAEVGWRKNLDVIASLPFKQVYATASPPAQDVHTGFADALLALRYGWRGGDTPVSFQAGWRGPMGYDPHLSPSLGDGRQTVFGAALMGAALPQFHGFVQGSAGFGYGFERTSKDSSETTIFYSGDAAVWAGQRVLLAANFHGSTSSTGSLDESFMELGPRVTVRVDDGIDILAGSSHTMTGRNVVHANRFYVGVAFKATRLTRYQGFTGSGSER